MENENNKYLNVLAQKMDKHSYFYIKLDTNDEYIVKFFAEYEAEVEFSDDSVEYIPSFAFKVLEVINNLSSNYEEDDIIESNIYNLIQSIAPVKAEDYIKDEKLKRILTVKRSLGLDEDYLYNLESNALKNELNLKNINLVGKFQIPSLKNTLGDLPVELTPYTECTNDENKESKYLHFYQYDERFDGKYGVWNTLKYNLENKKGFSLSKLDGYMGIITPDYSTYGDMPVAMQIYNIYRSRMVGASLLQRGFNVIPNVRWGSEETYLAAFSGLEDCDVIAVSTYGCGKATSDKKFFLDGFKELINIKRFKMIIIYGGLSKELIQILDTNSITYKQYPSSSSKAYKTK